MALGQVKSFTGGSLISDLLPLVADSAKSSISSTIMPSAAMFELPYNE